MAEKDIDGKDELVEISYEARSSSRSPVPRYRTVGEKDTRKDEDATASQHNSAKAKNKKNLSNVEVNSSEPPPSLPKQKFLEKSELMDKLKDVRKAKNQGRNAE